MAKMNDLFKVGDKIYGYCEGYFGRDDYYTKKCIMVTENYAVFEYTDNNSIIWDGYVTVLNSDCDDGLQFLTVNRINKWKQQEV